MHILFIRYLNPFYENSASGNRFAEIIKGLLMNNVQITLLVTGGYCTLKERENATYNNFHGLTIIYTINNVLDNYWKDRINTYILDYFWKSLNVRKIRKYLVGDYDYIWITNQYTILSTYYRYLHLIKHKSIIELNEFNDFYKYDISLTKLQRKKLQKTDKQLLLALNNIDILAVMTKRLIDYYRIHAKVEANFFHLPMTVNMSRFSGVTQKGEYKKPYIAFTGTYTNAKDGVDVLIKSFAKIAYKYPKFHLYLAGFWHYDVRVQKELIAKNNLENRVTYLGVLDKDQIPTFICNACLLVLSRPDSHQAQGGFPTKLGEYLATGNPVCVTSVGEIPNYLKDNVSAFIAEPGSIDSFANAMDRALCNQDNAKQVGATGRKVAEENFNSDIQAKRLYEFLKGNMK